MNYSEMLHDFLDSSLNGSGEETLFRALAADDELRFELKYLLKLRDAVRDDDEATVVPIASTNAIFSQLGYTAPAALVGAAGGIAGTQAGLWPLLKSAGGYLLATLVGAVVASGIFILNDDSGNGQPAMADKLTAPQTQTVPDAATQGTASGAPVVTAPTGTGTNNGGAAFDNFDKLTAAVERDRRNTSVDTKTANTTEGRSSGTNRPSLKESVAQNPQASDLTNGPAASADEQGTASLEEKEKISASATAATDRAAELLKATPQQEPLADSATIDGTHSDPATESRSTEMESPAPFTFEPKKSKEWREPTFSLGVRAAVLPFELTSATTALPESAQSVDNITASISYPLHRNLALMVEAGKESYLLTFKERRSDGRVLQHEVEPSVFWGGVGARYSFAPQSMFNPFVQVVGGGSEAGIIGRTMAGLQWSLNDQIGMMGGFEYNIAAYRFQGETTISPKLGANFGITFNLFGN